jgi:hypothetical protein
VAKTITYMAIPDLAQRDDPSSIVGWDLVSPRGDLIAQYHSLEDLEADFAARFRGLVLEVCRPIIEGDDG